MSAKRKGFSHERDLARRLWSYGLAVIRAPASGSKVKHLVYPDLVALYKGKILVIEVKTTSKPRSIYIEKDKVSRLLEFARRASGEAYIAVKIIGTGEWRFIPVGKLVNAGSKYKLPREAIESGIKLEALVSELKGVKKLDEFFSEKAK